MSKLSGMRLRRHHSETLCLALFGRVWSRHALILAQFTSAPLDSPPDLFACLGSKS